MHALNPTQVVPPRPAMPPVRRLAPRVEPVRQVLARAVRRTSAYATLDEVLGAARQWAGVPGAAGATLARLGGVAEAPRIVADEALAALDAVAARACPATLSLRPTALAYDADLIGGILLRAHELAVPVLFESQGPDTAIAVLACTQASHAMHALLGVTLPGRWMRSRADADLAVELGLRVRIVKGLWADPLRPQFDERAGVLSVVSRLAGKAAFVSVASHDAALVRAALTRLCDAGTPCELELSHGASQQAAVQVARSLGVPVRVYMAYGQTGAAAGVSGGQPGWWGARSANMLPFYGG
ncbi:MAG: hypothetical protein RIQ60_2183 [Pseudomonadota bacterium]